jgi:hypothetical protein
VARILSCQLAHSWRTAASWPSSACSVAHFTTLRLLLTRTAAHTLHCPRLCVAREACGEARARREWPAAKALLQLLHDDVTLPEACMLPHQLMLLSQSAPSTGDTQRSPRRSLIATSS